jgi:hypothetical protein
LQPVCLLLALHKLGMFDSIRRVLQHPNVVKVGIGIAHDMMDLLRSHEEQFKIRVRSLGQASAGLVSGSVHQLFKTTAVNRKAQCPGC